MAIRAATEDDVDVMVELATASRFAHHAWEPELWALGGTDHALHAVALSKQLADDAAITLVWSAATGDTVAAWVRAAPGSTSGTWVVQDFAVAASVEWRHSGAALLVALSARVAGAGGSRILLAAPHADHERGEVLASVGPQLVATVLQRATGARGDTPPEGVRAHVGADADDVARLLVGTDPVGDSLGARGGGGTTAEGLVVDDGHGVVAAAAVRPVRRVGVTRAGRRIGIVEPLEVGPDASWDDAGRRLLEGVEWLANGRGEEHLLVPCAIGAVPKAAMLESAGYRHALDVWCLGV
jgi:hypothetical protein